MQPPNMERRAKPKDRQVKCLAIGGPLQPCNRALFSSLPAPIVLLAHGCTLPSWKFGKIMPEGFGKMLDAIAALGFATAMDVSGVNIVGIEQQRDFARRGQLRWPRASALVEWHDGNIHTTNFPPAKSAVRYARWSNSPCAAASCDSTSPTKGEHSTRRPLAGRCRISSVACHRGGAIGELE